MIICECCWKKNLWTNLVTWLIKKFLQLQCLGISYQKSKYYTARTVPKSNQNITEIEAKSNQNITEMEAKSNQNITEIEAKSNQNITEIEAKSIPLTHIYMTAQLSWLQYKVVEVNWFYGSKLPFLVKWCSHASVFQVWVKCRTSHLTKTV